MKVLLTSTGLATTAIQDAFINMLEKDLSLVKVLFIPTAAIDADAIAVLPKCMNDLLKCGIRKDNIIVYDMHAGMGLEELRQYDVVYFCGGNPSYLLGRVNETGFREAVIKYIQEDGIVIGVSAGSLIFSNNLDGNLGLINIELYVHCPVGEKRGRVSFPFKEYLKLTNRCALVIRKFPDALEIIGE